MPNSIQTVLDQVAKKIVPSVAERERMSQLAERLKGQVQNILDNRGFGGNVSIQGSFARNTWLSGEADLDIFASFPPSMDRQEWTEKILPEIRKRISAKTIDRYAEHPYLEFHITGIRVNVVPCYSVEKGQWKSATDRTPYHTEYMTKHLTEQMRLEARLLKRFTKGIRSYGAEIRVGGFSGMLVETLILHYHSFLETLTQASRWKPIIFLDIESPGGNQDSRAREFDSPLVVIDPVDSNRNLAAAVRDDKLWGFAAASRELQEHPGMWYFFPQKYRQQTKAQFSKIVKDHNRDIVAISFEHPRIVPDVLWGQLLKTENSITGLMTRQDFHPIRSTVWSDEARLSAILIELDRSTLTEVQLRLGPPVSKMDDSQGFLDRHVAAKETVRGPWIEADRWVVDKKRRLLTVEHLVMEALKDPRLGLTIPDQLDSSFRKNVKVLENGKILALLGREGFDQALSEFLAAKPAWLKTHH
ncbi:MAG TPA: CCA tRNA nucleotidyltransferase [Candidatus Bathyarchaeia archaeon]|nr:CCA tRNA nucleotidyltransferase [Candidatus Bathyarchaeia archaeon]